MKGAAGQAEDIWQYVWCQHIWELGVVQGGWGGRKDRTAEDVCAREGRERKREHFDLEPSINPPVTFTQNQKKRPEPQKRKEKSPERKANMKTKKKS